jgi:signal transduction histidine kinase
MDKETLAVIESGCSERLGRPLTILDFDPQTEGFSDRIESINEKQRYEGFCRLLRDGARIEGGDQACEQADIAQAKESLQEFYRTESPFRTFQCHMGLADMTYIVQIRNRPVAIAFSGQYCPAVGVASIHEKIQGLGTGSQSHIKLAEAEREQLLRLAEKLQPMPEDARGRLEREAKHIQRIAEAEFELYKRQWEQEFLDELRRVSLEPGELNRKHLQKKLGHILELIKEFCHCDYAVFFCSVREGETVLTPLAEAGVPSETVESLPHFNWKKAGLPLESFDARGWDIAQCHYSSRKRGIRGDNSEYFDGASCVIPTSLGDRYRGVLVLGPFSEPVSIQGEQRFLIEIANTVGVFALTELEVLDLERERRRWSDTAKLLVHQLGTALTPITIQIGRANALIEKGGVSTDVKRISDFVNRAEDLALLLAQSAKETLAGHVLQVETDDLEFERYSLSVLVGNCAAGFLEKAEKEKLELVVDQDVEFLPDADVDVARLMIALANLIDNAIKYSYSGRKIYIRSHLDSTTDTDRAAAIIEIDNLGYGIRKEDRERIFESGTRGLTAAKLGRIPGSGLGLWEARAVAVAHGGEIRVRCDRTSFRSHMGRGYHVVFSMKIPLNQKERERG